MSDGKAAADGRNDKKKPPPCPLCNSSHDLDECRNFNKIEEGGRRKFLSKQKLCYGCCEKISQSHTAHNYLIQRTCKICAYKHPTGLHGLKLKRKGDNSASYDIRQRQSRVIVPISVIPSVQQLLLVKFLAFV